MQNIEELCCYYVALLRSVSLLHQNNHWISSGSNFYGNHLLFERIYKTAVEDSDLAAEKFVGLFGKECIDLHMQAQIIGEILKEFSDKEPVKGSLEIEEKFLKVSEKLYETLESEGKLSLGLDDMVMSIASSRESSIYLLKQITSGGEGQMVSKINARMSALKQIKLAQQSNTALELQKRINLALSVNLGNRNWGVVKILGLGVSEDNGNFTLMCNIEIPSNSPPFKDKTKYPSGLNQFKQELFNLNLKVANDMGIQNLAQFTKVNNI